MRKLQEHWVRHPRTEWLVAAYLKYTPPQQRQVGDMADLFRSVGLDPDRKHREVGMV
jgi:hypothetical protein